MKKPFIPFWLMPGSWGLKGKTRERAQAEYELKGTELRRKLAQIDNTDEFQLKLALLEIDADCGKIDDYEYDTERVKIEHRDNELARNLALLAVQLHHGEIDQNDHDKRSADLKGEPFICVLNSTYDPTKQHEGFALEFDWNENWIKLLAEKGYVGVSQEHIIQQWFDDVCQSVASERMDDQPIPMNRPRVVRRPPGEGPTEYR